MTILEIGAISILKEGVMEDEDRLDIKSSGFGRNGTVR
jgi:hypothetical protein